MTPRSIVLSTAALLLFTAITPMSPGLSPTAAVAEQLNKSERGIERPRKGERVQRKGSDRKAEREAERKAEKAERKAERKAEKAERKAEKAERKAERREERKAERREERKAERRDERKAERRDERKAERRPERAERRKEAAPQQSRQEPPRRARGDDTPQREVDQRARIIISDNRPAADLDNRDLRKRLDDNRAILGTGKLSRGEEQQLRAQLHEDREELRDRVASRQEAEQPRRRASDGDRPRRERTSRREHGARDVVIDREWRRSSDDLSDSDLEQRVRSLNRQLRQERLARQDAEIAREMVERDRREMRRRLHSDRDRRRERRRDARSRNESIIEFNVGYQMPPVIYAAEAMPRDIEMQLVAPPAQRMSRSYSYQEIATNQDVREMMPGIEVDTLNFDFGSAEVRPEEIDKLDEIAWVIEDIVAERPDEVFLIEGHTDAVGSDPANDALSRQRALAVRDALLDYYDIQPQNLETVGLGERYLRIWTQEPEEENRRVTVRRITPLLAGGRG